MNRIAARLLPGLAYLVAALPAAAQDGGRDDAWFRIISEDGTLIGYQHETIEPAAEGWTVVRVREMAFRVEGHGPNRFLQRLTRVLDGQGRTQTAVLEWDLGEGKSYRRYRFLAESVEIDRSDGMRRQSETLSLPGHLPFRDLDALLPDPQDLALSEKLIGFGEGSLRLSVLNYRVVPSGRDGEQAAMAVANGLPVHILLLDRAENGEITRAVRPLFGSRIVIERSLEPIGSEDLSAGRVIPHQSVKAPFAIPRSALQGHIRYQFTLAVDPGLALPGTGEQRVTRSGSLLQLDICEGCGPGLSTDPKDLQRWREPSEWIESDTKAIRKSGERVARLPIADAAKMVELGKIARRRLPRIDYAGHYSAAEAWKRRRGDCTEDAVVLAALARAAGLPALVVNGFVYSRQRYHGASETFVPHSWVLAYTDGLWRSYDISAGGFDATHIAMTIGDGDAATIAAANQLAGLLQWEQMAEVRKRPAD